MTEESLWVEKYRPKKIDECVLPDRIIKVFQNMAKEGKLTQHLLLAGSAGIGKTTIARALCNEIDADLLFINASLDRNIDTLRTKILNFATSASLTGRQKVVILDEADGANPQSFQPALRAFMEEFSSNCKFILTCNFKNKLIEPIHSRCAVIEFVYDKKESVELMTTFFKRICTILDREQVEHDKKVLIELVHKYYPDMRRALNELQRYATRGPIDAGILAALGDVQIEGLVKMMRDKDFKAIRKWVAQNSDLDPDAIFTSIYEASYSYLKPNSVPQAIIILNDAQYKAAFVANPEINLLAAIVQMMVECEFK